MREVVEVLKDDFQVHVTLPHMQMRPALREIWTDTNPIQQLESRDNGHWPLNQHQAQGWFR